MRGEGADVKALADDQLESGVPHGAELLAFAEAIVTGAQSLPRARAAVVEALAFGEALYMHLTGTPLNAEDAHRIGLVHKVLPDREAMMQEAEAIAEEIKLAAPLALQAIKRLGATSLLKTGDDVDAQSKVLSQQVAKSEDAKEGPRAFAEKRKPVWKMR